MSIIKRLFYIWIIALSVATITFINSEAATSDSFTITVTVTSGVSSSITTPADGVTCSQTPAVTGTATADQTVTIKGTSGGSVVQVASATADASGDFVAQVSSDTPLDVGSNTLTPYIGSTAGTSVTVTVEENPSTDEEPQITSPQDGERVKGKRPTISGYGKAGETVELFAKDKDGNITSLGTTTVGADGTFSITPSSDLSCGTTQLYVVVGGVACKVIEVILVDPYGVVFDSETNQPIKGAELTLYYDNDPAAGRDWIVAEPGTQLDATDTNPQTTGSDGTYSYNVINGDYYFSISSSGYTYPSTKSSFPSGRTIVTGSKSEIFTVSGTIIEMDQPMDFSGASLLKITKDANKGQVSVGDVITYTVTIKNEGSTDVKNVYLKDKLAGGFKYLADRAKLDGVTLSNPTGTTTKTFDIGTVSANSTKTLRYQVVVGSGITFGKYENNAWCAFSNDRKISNTASETVEVIPEALFDLGTIVGKVFLDLDEDGRQDGVDETGISNVQIVTEDGAVITTDKNGKYHLKGIALGRHLLRIDENSLPKNSYLTTPKVVIVDVTPGLITKVNFGVNSTSEVETEGLPVKIIQKREIPKPRLNVALYPSPVISHRTTEHILEQAHDKYEFRIFTNYQLFIKGWKIEILDKDTKALIKTFEGSQLTLNEPIYWDGKDKYGRWLNPEHNYIYILTVTGKDGNKDKTKEKELPVKYYEPAKDRRNQGETKQKKLRMFDQESRINNLDEQNIKVGEKLVLIEGESLITSKKNKQEKEEKQISIRIDNIPIFVNKNNRQFSQEVIISNREHQVIVESIDEEGKRKKRIEIIKREEKYPLFVAISGRYTN